MKENIKITGVTNLSWECSKYMILLVFINLQQFSKGEHFAVEMVTDVEEVVMLVSGILPLRMLSQPCEVEPRASELWNETWTPTSTPY